MVLLFLRRPNETYIHTCEATQGERFFEFTSLLPGVLILGERCVSTELLLLLYV